MARQLDFSTVAFTSHRLSLRAFTAADAGEAFDAAGAAVTRFMSWEPSPSLEAFADVWREWLPRMRAGIELHLVLRLLPSGEFLGVAALHDIGNGEPEIGIWLKESAHGLGYGREAIAAMVAWACAHLGAKFVIYPVVEINHPSRRLAESLSGVIAGHRVLKKANASSDEVVYCIPCARPASLIG
jgi:RimJ/RimL family protein N-acetyltransferase